MIKISCDICMKDLTLEEKAWTVQMLEYKGGSDKLQFHLCDEHRKILSDAIAKIARTESENGNS